MTWEQHSRKTGLTRVTNWSAGLQFVLLAVSFLLPEFGGVDRSKQCQVASSVLIAWVVFALVTLIVSLIVRAKFAAGLIGGTLLLFLLAFPSFRIMRAGGCGMPPESEGMTLLRAINTAEVTYLSSNAGKFGSIPELVSQGLLDKTFLYPISGYTLAVSASGSNYTATAMPNSMNAGKYGYYSGPDAVIRYAVTPTETCQPCFPANQSGQPVG
jgi:hypothetical protein